MCVAHILGTFITFYSHKAVHSSWPSRPLLNRPISSLISDGVTDIVAVMCSSGNSTCICQGKHFLPSAALSERRALWSDRRPHAAITEKQSRTRSAVRSAVLTAVTRRMWRWEWNHLPLYLLLPYQVMCFHNCSISWRLWTPFYFVTLNITSHLNAAVLFHPTWVS